ncbi:MAG: alpha/beta hydrolase [Chloroflexi bacterium]|nr:alpha/beta hydrolase [Chloroflexota bacterium]
MMMYPIYEFDPRPNDTRPVLHLAHANGFPPETYAPLAEFLAARFRVVMLPARPLWPDPPPPEAFNSWHDMADDLIAGIEEHQLGPVVGAGHSMGGTASMFASIKRPDLFRALILIDPVILPRPILRLWTRALKNDSNVNLPLAEMTMRRRRQWENREEAFSRFRKNPLFTRWPDSTVWAYVDGLTRSVPNANGAIELRYSPEWEAHIYNHVPIDAWHMALKIQHPTLVLQGETTDTFTDKSKRFLQRIQPDIPIISVAQTGHLLPMENPQLVAEEMLTFVENRVRFR